MTLTVNSMSCPRKDFALRITQWRAEPGRVVAILGTNGAGKSTLFSALSGDISYQGHICLHAKSLSSWERLRRARHVGVLQQNSQMAFDFTAGEVVTLGCTPLKCGHSIARKRVREMMVLTDTEHLSQRPFAQLSGGERQRVSLARTLVQLSDAEQAPLLLLDEPTSAQDIGHQHGVLSLARSLARERGYIVVTVLHDLNHAMMYADECLVLSRGSVSRQGPSSEVLTPGLIDEVWGCRPSLISHETGKTLVFPPLQIGLA